MTPQPRPTPNILAGGANPPVNELALLLGPGAGTVELNWDGYDQLPDADRVQMVNLTAEIKAVKQRTDTGLFEQGRLLAEAKQRLPFGQWGRYLEMEYAYSIDVADRLVAIYKHFGQIPRLAESSSRSALAMLAAPSVPEPARAEAIQRAEAGETITIQRAKEIIAEHQPPEPEPVQTPQALALAAVRAWLRDRPAAFRDDALRNWNVPPYSNTIRDYIAGLPKEAVKAAVTYLRSHPEAYAEPAPAPENRKNPAENIGNGGTRANGSNGSRPSASSRPHTQAPRDEDGEAPPRPRATTGPVSLTDGFEVQALANVLEGARIIPGGVASEDGRRLQIVTTAGTILLAAITEDGVPVLAWRMA